MLEFLFGAALAILYLRWPRETPNWLPIAGVGLALAGLAISITLDAADVLVPNKHDARFLILGIPALLVVAGALAAERGGWILKQRFFLELGAASYVLYLFHQLIMQMTVKVIHPILPAAPAVAGVVAAAACVAVSVAIHRRVEQPILDMVRQLTRRRSRKAEPVLIVPSIQPAE